MPVPSALGLEAALRQKDTQGAIPLAPCVLAFCFTMVLATEAARDLRLTQRRRRPTRPARPRSAIAPGVGTVVYARKLPEVEASPQPEVARSLRDR